MDYVSEIDDTGDLTVRPQDQIVLMHVAMDQLGAKRTQLWPHLVDEVGSDPLDQVALPAGPEQFRMGQQAV